jgi:hypothetical protein
MAEEVKQLGEDHEVWLKCFVATLPGATTALGAENTVRPEHIVSICAAIADARSKRSEGADLRCIGPGRTCQPTI